MKYTTGLPVGKFADLLARLREEGVEGYPPSLGLRGSLRAALIYMRHNIVQAVIGEQLDVSQPTVSRAIKVMTGAIILALRDMLLTAQKMPEGCDYVLDGTLFPCWSWRAHRELWSGKHKTTGMNASDPGPAQRQARVGLIPTPAPCTTWPHQAPSGLLDGLDPSGWIADKGYIGRGMITPHKKPPTAN